MYKNNFKSCVMLLLLTVLIGIPIKGVFAINSKEYGTILNLSGKQRMLSQKMSKESILIGLNIDTISNLSNLKKTSSLFDKTLKGLRDGNKELKLPQTTTKRILKQIKKVDNIWQPFYKIVKDIITTKKVSKDNISYIAKNSLPLLKQMNKCVKLYEKEAIKAGLKGNPGLAVSINLSGKQRMLTQKMSKEFFLIAYGHEIKNNQLNLKETSQLFDRTIKGLISGDKILDLPETKNKTIVAQLEIVKKLWGPFQTVINSGTQDTKISQESIKTVSSNNIPLLKEMNKAVGMYEQEAAK